MIDDDLRAAIYAAMADEDSGQVPEQTRMTPSQNSTFVLDQGATKVELATADYARRLEQTVNAQARVIEQMQRQFARISSALRTHRQTSQRLNYQIDDLARDLDQKIDRRD